MGQEVRLEMPHDSARRVVLAHALDEVDRGGQLIPSEERMAVTRRRAEGEPRPERWLATRAQDLVESLARREPKLAALAEPWPLRGPLVLCWLLALSLGLGSNALGLERGVNILAPPLLGLIAWNLVLFILLTGGTLRRALLPPEAERSPRPPLVNRWLVSWRRRFLPQEDSPAARVALRHLEDWMRAAAPLQAAGGRAALHLAAALMVAGTVAGMYLRGLIFEYRASWESTFLSPGAVDALLAAVLAPAKALFALELSAAADLRAPASEPAGPWIHAWAITAGLVVILPRCLLAAAEVWRVSRLRRALPLTLPEAYLRRLSAAASTRRHDVAVLPYSFRPVERSVEDLRQLLLDLAGARARVRFGATVAYGERPEAPESEWRVLLFNLAQTPEVEVHGELIEELRLGLADGQRFLVLVDEGPLMSRTAADQREQRLHSRRRSWRRVIENAGMEPIFLHLGEDDGTALERLVAAAWPPLEKGGGT